MTLSLLEELLKELGMDALIVFYLSPSEAVIVLYHIGVDLGESGVLGSFHCLYVALFQFFNLITVRVL